MGYAALQIDFKFIKDIPDAITSSGNAHFEGDIWIEPERRYNLTVFKKLIAAIPNFSIEDKWRIADLGDVSAVYENPSARAIHVIVESADFPDVPMGRMLPTITPHMGYHWVGESYVPYFIDFNMSEVRRLEEELQK